MTNYTINTLPTAKKALAERLYKAGHITLDELLELLKEPTQVKQLTEEPFKTRIQAIDDILKKQTDKQNPFKQADIKPPYPDKTWVMYSSNY